MEPGCVQVLHCTVLYKLGREAWSRGVPRYSTVLYSIVMYKLRREAWGLSLSRYYTVLYYTKYMFYLFVT